MKAAAARQKVPTTTRRDSKQHSYQRPPVRVRESVSTYTAEDTDLLSIALAFYDMYQSCLPEDDRTVLRDITTCIFPIFKQIRHLYVLHAHTHTHARLVCTLSLALGLPPPPRPN